MRTRRAIATGLMFAALAIGAAALFTVPPRAAIAGDAQDVDALVARLVGDDAKATAEAADALVALGVAAIPRLSATAEPVAARTVMLETLGRIAAEHDEGIAALVTALGDKDAAIRAAAARGLCAAGTRAKSAEARLKAALTDNFVTVRIAAAAALIRCGGDVAAFFPTIVPAFTNKDATIRATAMDLLRMCGAPAKSALTPALAGTRDVDASVRLAALRTIVALGVKEPRVIEALGRAANSWNDTERREALAAIPKFTDEAVPEVIRLGGALRGDRLHRRQLAKMGGDKQTEAAVAAALDWLARHQSPNGEWEADAYRKQCRTAKCEGTSDYFQNNTGLTGLALLAFLGAGESHLDGPHKDGVSRGIAYIRGIMGSDGERDGCCFGPTPDDKSSYNHAIATVALCEAYMLTADPEIKSLAARAVGFSMRAKNPYLAWHYKFPPSGDNDTSVTGWQVWGLATARAAGIVSEDRAFTDATCWIAKMTGSDGRTGYQDRGGTSVRFTDLLTKYPPDKGEALTAIGFMARAFAGKDAYPLNTSSDFSPDMGLVQKRLPDWDADAGTIDFYYWFWGSMAMRQVGDNQRKSWNDALKSALIPNQRKDSDGCARGSWDPIDAWSSAGGRVYSTAMCCMALESYWRMDSISTAK